LDRQLGHPITLTTERMGQSTTLLGELTPSWKSRLRRRVLAWYASHARNLPWRRQPTAYRVWVSEIMLQQTQVATVQDYYERFLAAFPTVHDLAAAEEGYVLRMWEGLGYYRRARQMHAAARQMVDQLGGQFPADVQGLRRLPGVGRYTAGAIGSLAMGLREPILEANTIRLLSRLVGYREDPGKAAGGRLLWQTATEILPRKQVAAFNQGLMELGSLVCTPNTPRCDVCPVAALCAAQIHGQQEKIPLPKPKQNFTELHEAAVVVRKNGRVLLRQCADGQRWAGLWDFPRFEISYRRAPRLQRELTEKVREQTGIQIEPGRRLQTIRHGVTRYRITLDCYEARCVGGRLQRAATSPLRWVSPAELNAFPLSTTGRKLAKMVVVNRSSG
jgi:A/G-specific adenine glycosylase